MFCTADGCTPDICKLEGSKEKLRMHGRRGGGRKLGVVTVLWRLDTASSISRDTRSAETKYMQLSSLHFDSPTWIATDTAACAFATSDEECSYLHVGRQMLCDTSKLHAHCSNLAMLTSSVSHHDSHHVSIIMSHIISQMNVCWVRAAMAVPQSRRKTPHRNGSCDRPLNRYKSGGVAAYGCKVLSGLASVKP